jgi:hypothetical protein
MCCGQEGESKGKSRGVFPESARQYDSVGGLNECVYNEPSHVLSCQPAAYEKNRFD